MNNKNKKTKKSKLPLILTVVGLLLVVGATAGFIFQDKIKTTVGIDLFSETFVGQVPLATRDVNTVPNFILNPNLQNVFNLQTTANISFDEATRLAKQQFQDKEFPMSSEEKKVKITDISVYQEKENIVIEAHTTGEVNGTAFIKGKPYYSAEEHKIKLNVTDFNLKTKNFFQINSEAFYFKLEY